MDKPQTAKEILADVVELKFGDRSVQVGRLPDGDIGINLCRPLTAFDTEGLTEEEISEGIVNPTAKFTREDNQVKCSIRLSEEAAHALMQALTKVFEAKQ